jgi:hypothetical protein
MRCKACDTLLTDFERTRKSSKTNEFIDLCNYCYKSINSEVQAIERLDLINIQDEVDSEDEL